MSDFMSTSRMNHPRKSARRPARRGYQPVIEHLEDRRLFAVNVTEFHYDYQSTGVNANETQLTPSNVNPSSFGKQFTTPVDGQVYAQPLVMTNLVIGGTSYAEVVYVATQHDSLYAIDGNTGAILWQRSFLDTTNPNDYLPNATSVTSIPNGDTGSGDINPEIGITGTPVIDPSTDTLYVVPNTKQMVSTGVNAGANYVQQLHAIDITTGNDRVASVPIGDTYNGNTNVTPIYTPGTGDGNVGGVVQFNALRENNRPALSLVGGNVYVEWASHGDNGPYHGWVARWDVSTIDTQGNGAMTLNGVLDTDPNGAEAGIWQGGGGLTFEPDGSAFYFETGNGAPRGGDPTLDANGFPTDHNYYESLVKAVNDPSTNAANQNNNGWGMKIVDYFTPFNVNALDNADEDFGSGAPLILPDSAGIPGHPHLIVAAGKEGKIYLIDRDNMGKFQSGTDYNPTTGVGALNSVFNGTTYTPPTLINGSLSTPAFYHGELYWVSGYSNVAKAFIIGADGTIQETSETTNGNFGYVPGSVVVSTNGNETNDAIVWIIDRNNNELHAYSGLSLSTELWNSNDNPGDALDSTVKFAAPVVANGQVFVGTNTALTIYGLVAPPAQAAAPNTPVLNAPLVLSGTAVQLNWTDSSVSPNFANSYTIEESTDGIHFIGAGVASAQSTTFTVTGLSPTTQYYFRISGTNSAGTSGFSVAGPVTTTNQTGSIPTQPVGLGAVPAGPAQVYLNWVDTATDQTGFTLVRATDSNFTQNVVTQTLAAAPYYYTDTATGLAIGQTYYYYIQATNSNGSSSTSNTAIVTIPNVPPAPSDGAAVQSGNQVTVSWTDHAGPYALGYQIFRSVDGGQYSLYANLPETSDAPPTTYSYVDTSVSQGHTYSYQIYAQNTSGFSAPTTAAATIFGVDNVTLDAAGHLVLVAAPGTPNRLSVSVSGGVYTLTDPAAQFTVGGSASGSLSGAGSSTLTFSASAVSSISLDTGDQADTINILSAGVPVTITADSGGGTPVIDLGPASGATVFNSSITNLSSGTITIDNSSTTSLAGPLTLGGGLTNAGAGATTISGTISLVGSASLTTTGGTVSVTGSSAVALNGFSLNLAGTGNINIAGNISGNAAGSQQGLVGNYYQNLPQTGNGNNGITQLDNTSPSWIGNITPTDVVQTPNINFPAIGDGTGDQSFLPYANVGISNIGALWTGEVNVPDLNSGQPYNVTFLTGSDDGSVAYIGSAVNSITTDTLVVNNNFFQGTNFKSGVISLAPGLHAISVAYYNGGGGATMFLQWNLGDGNGNVMIPNADLETIHNLNTVSKSGSGTATLSGNNTYVGATTVNGGTLVLGSATALGNTTTTTVVASGATLVLDPNTTLANPISLAGTISDASGSSTLSGAVTLTGNATVTGAGNIAINGGIAGNGNLTFSNAGNDTVSAINLTTGGVTFANSGGVTVTGGITSTGNMSITGSGTTLVQGDVNLGTAPLSDTGSGTATFNGHITGGGGVVAGGLVGDYWQISDPLSLGGSNNWDPLLNISGSQWIGTFLAANFPNAPHITKLTPEINFTDINDNGFSDPNGFTISGTTNGPANFNNSAFDRQEGYWHGFINITTAGQYEFRTNSDDGSAIYIDGNLIANNPGPHGGQNADGLTPVLSVGLHQIDIPYYNSGGGASMEAYWNPNPVTSDDGNFQLITSSYLFSGSTTGISMSGTGTLNLNNSNTYPGQTTVTKGTIVVGANGALGDTTGTTVVSGTGTVAFNGVNYTTSENFAISGTGAAGRDGALDNLTGATTLAGTVTSSGVSTLGATAGSLTLSTGLTVTSGTTTVGGDSGATINIPTATVTGGTLNFGNNSGAQTNVGTITATGGAISFGNSGSVTVSGAISTTHTLGITGSGTTVVQGAVSLGTAPLVDTGSGSATFNGHITGGGAGAQQGLIGNYFQGGHTNDDPYIDPTSPSYIGNGLNGTYGASVTNALTPNINFANVAASGFTEPGFDVDPNSTLPSPKMIGDGGTDGTSLVNTSQVAYWHGFMNFPTAGVYQLEFSSDDGSAIAIDGQRIVYNPGGHGTPGPSPFGLVTITVPGLHQFDAAFYNGGGGAAAQVLWDPVAGQTGNLVIVPASEFSTSPISAISMAGTGSLTLNNTNTYPGGTNVTNGTLIVGADGALSAGGTTNVNGGTLALAGGITYSTSQTLNIAGSGAAGTGGALESLTGNDTLTLPVAFSANGTIGAATGSSLTLQGAITIPAAATGTIGGGGGNVTANGTITGGGVTIGSGSGNVTVTNTVNSNGALVTLGGSGQDNVSGNIVGGLTGTLQGSFYSNTTSQVSLLDNTNSNWIGNPAVNTPVSTGVVHDIDYPSIDSIGFVNADYAGDTPSPNPSGNNVSARFVGSIVIPNVNGDGSNVSVGFTTGSDDGSVIYIDNALVVNNNFDQGVTYRTGTASLSPGQHTIDIEYRQGNGGAAVFAGWNLTDAQVGLTPGTEKALPNPSNNAPAGYFLLPSAVLTATGNGLLKTGTGTAILSGTNSFTGTDVIAGGVLSVAADTNLGDPGNAIKLTGGVLGITATFPTTRLISTTSSTSGIDVASGVTFSPPTSIGGSGAINKTGLGTLVLPSTNPYVGGTTITGGTVVAGGALPLGTGPVTMNGGTLQFNSSNNTTQIVQTPVTVSGFNQDEVWATSETNSLVGTTVGVDGSGHVFYQAGVPFTPGGGLPTSGTIQSVANPATSYALQPYTGNNALYASTSDTSTHTLSLGTPDTFANLTLLATGADGAATFTVTLNYTTGSPTTASLTVPDWFSGVNGAAISGLRDITRSATGLTYGGDANDPSMYDVVIPAADIDSTRQLSSIGVARTGGGELSVFAVAGTTTHAPLAYVNNVVVANDSTINLNLTSGQSLGVGTLTLAGKTLTVSGNPSTTLSFGATTLTATPSGIAAGSGTTVALGPLNDGGSPKVFNLSGAGTVTLGSTATSIVNGTAINVSNGTTNLNAAGAVGTLGAVTVSSPGSVALGASQTFGSLTGSGNIGLGGNTLTVGSTNNLSSSYGGGLSSGSLVKAGTGTLTLTGSSTLTANSDTSGTLQVDGSLLGPLSVSSNAGLAGIGTVSAVTTSGTVAPGDSGVGTLTTAGLAFTGGSYAVELASTSSGDKIINGSGVVALGNGVAALNISRILGYAGVNNTPYTIIANNGTATTGFFSNFPIASGTTSAQVIVNNVVYTVNYAGGVSGHDVVLNLVHVPAATPSQYVVTAGTTSAPADTVITYTVTAEDSFGSTITGYSGTHSTSVSATGQSFAFPANVTFTNGVASFTGRLRTAGSQTVTVSTTEAVTAGSISETVSALNVTHFSIVAPNTVQQGNAGAFSITVTARDKFNNEVTNYTGDVTFTSSDTSNSVVLPPDTHFANQGHQTFTGVVLQTLGGQTISVSDGDGFAGTSNAITVSTAIAGPVTHFTVVAGSGSSVSTVAGNGVFVTITALDGNNVVNPNFAGPVTITSTDSQHGESAISWANGVGTLVETFKTVGSQTITATNGSSTGTSNAVTVSASTPAKLTFGLAPTGTAIGNALSTVTVKVLDAFGNPTTVPDSSGSVTLSLFGNSSGGSFTGSSTLTQPIVNGVATFSNLTLNKPGTYSLAEVTTGVTGGNLIGPVSSSFVIDPLKLVSVQALPNAFVFNFNTKINPSALQLYGVGANATNDVVVTIGNVTIPGTLIIDPSDTKATFEASAGFLSFLTANQDTFTSSPILQNGTYSIVLQSSGDKFFQDVFGNGLAGNGTTPGTNSSTSVSVTSGQNPTVYAPEFPAGPQQVLNVPSDAEGTDQTFTGLPISIVNGAGATSGSVTLNYDPTLLTLTNGSGAVAPGSGLGFFNVSITTPGTALITFGGGTGISDNTNWTLGTIQGSVNATFNSAYGAKDLLHFTNLSLTGATGTAQTADGLHINVLPGDASRNGKYDVNDSNDAGTVAAKLDTGFEEFPLVDPAVISDLNGLPDPVFSYGVDAGDTSELLQAAAQLFPTFDIASAPPHYTGTAGTTGPDPTVSIPTNLTATAGGTVSVPVNIDTAKPAGSTGLTFASLTITYDPKAFTVAPTDIHLGTVTAGWNLVSTVDASTGTIRIDLSSSTPSAAVNGGSLVTIDFHANPGASGTSVINLGAATYLADTHGPLTLTPAPTDGLDSVDGSVAISADDAWIADVAKSNAGGSDLDSVFAGTV